MSRQLTEVFERTLWEIGREISKKASAKFNKAKDESMPELKAIEKRISDIQKERDRLYAEERKLKDEKERIDPPYEHRYRPNNIDKDILNAMNLMGISISCLNDSDIKAYESIKDDIEITNLKAFKEIEKTYRYLFDMASTPKQKQQVILKLHWYDWQSLWINIPPSLNIDVVIKDWVILTPSLPNKETI